MNNNTKVTIESASSTTKYLKKDIKNISNITKQKYDGGGRGGDKTDLPHTNRGPRWNAEYRGIFVRLFFYFL